LPKVGAPSCVQLMLRRSTIATLAVIVVAMATLIGVSECYDRRLKRDAATVRKESTDTIRSLNAIARELSSAPSTSASATRCFGESGRKWKCY